MRSLEDLLEEAKNGRLTDVELEYIANRIKYFDPDKEDDGTLCDLLMIIEDADCKDVIAGKQEQPRAVKYRDLIEPYLEYPRYDYISAVALSILCQSTWGFAGEYLEIISKFIVGVEWDYGDCTICALSAAGEYLHQKKDTELEQKDIELAFLLKSVMNDETRDEVDRDAAYEALARASGLSWNDVLVFPEQKRLKDSHPNIDSQNDHMEEV